VKIYGVEAHFFEVVWRAAPLVLEVVDGKEEFCFGFKEGHHGAMPVVEMNDFGGEGFYEGCSLLAKEGKSVIVIRLSINF
jgi:hypothetical protein